MIPPAPTPVGAARRGEGYDVQGFWGYTDGSGGVSVVEVDSSETIAMAVAAFIPWLKFSVRPIVPIQDSVAITNGGIAFRNASG